MAIKVDLEKAYDKLNWRFIYNVMLEMGIPENLHKIIMERVTTSTMNLLRKDSKSEMFQLGRGIRLGDPFSPYLFVICMDKLSHNISEKVDDVKWHLMRASRRGPKISHLMFTDDLLLIAPWIAWICFVKLHA
ncbi:hypothetical protein L6164_000004 [Bauhinia variegata]|uniref:Uncharacterized protein n=1 Tax=Bauhinia variegata TaxID=167791 RepID=A0ACB9Q563_BAUVA|nr:hypothetical protein L6164_000004 [Bauhinia variegata]